MITPVLEKAVLSGKATFKTFNIGGMGKNVLEVPNDRFFVITKIISYPHFPVVATQPNPFPFLNRAVYQLNINTGQRAFHYAMRNSFSKYYDSTDDSFNLGGFGPPVNIDTYLVCQQDISFVFCSPADNGLTTPAGAVKVTDSRSAGTPPVIGYGKEGQAGGSGPNLSSDTVRQADYNAGVFIRQNEFEETGITQGSQVFNEYRVAVDDVTRYASGGISANDNIDKNYQYPLGNIHYVDVFGLPTDLQ